MRNRRFLLAALGSIVLGALPARAEDPKPPVPAPVPSPAPAPPAEPPPAPVDEPAPHGNHRNLRPGKQSLPPWKPGRADLVIPDEIWARVLEGIERPGGVLGFTPEQMAAYGRDQRITRPIANLFRDVRSILRTSGKVTDDLLAAAKDPAELIRIGYGLTDAVAGRMFPKPTGAEWGTEWLPATTTPADALEIVLKRFADLAHAEAAPLPADAAKAWRSLPDPVQRLVVRFLVGSAEAYPWLRVAFDEPFLVRAVDGQGPQDLTAARLLKLAARPWTDEDETQTATLSRASFDALGRVDRDYLAYASAVYLTHVGVALDEWRIARDKVELPKCDGGAFWLDTALGAVRVLGPGADKVDPGAAPALLIVDLGGDDTYLGRQAVPAYPGAPISAIVDLAGNDVYDGQDVEGTMACGLFGIGAIFDLAGDDKYTVKASGLGCAWYGTGVLHDEAGKDVYVVKTRWGEGAAHVGVGLLVDLTGDDAYECAEQSQALGSTYGAGILLDVEGNDAYVARDDGNKEKIYLDQSVAMAQGCGFGRRADIGDGHSLAGGFGVLVDGAGDDRYHAQCWAQGCGYWWACGILEDRGGNDVYENGKYSLGAAAHFGVGCQVDLAGDDAYNQGVLTAVDQYQGHARDGSIGISVDGDGNDKYQFRNLCGGCGDLCSIALFWDRRGDDVYDVRWNDLGPPNGWTETPPFGAATTGEPLRSFRDDLPNVGVFLDTQGHDTYRWDTEARQPAKDGGEWKRRNGPRAFGYGLDAEVYPDAKTPAPEAPKSGPAPTK